jgi:hypothetical protein
MEQENREVRLRGLQEESSNLKALIDNLGWKELEKIADEQVKLRIPSALGKLENVLEVTKVEFEKGEIAGIQLFVQLPGMRIEAVAEEIAGLEEELGYDDAERSAGPDDGNGDHFEPAI